MARPTRAPDVMRGIAGGAILGVPLLYTQEVWFHGASLDGLWVLPTLAATFGLNVVLSYYVGFERGRIHRPVEDAVVGLGLSILLSAILLALIGRIDAATSWQNATGIIALTAVPVSIGFALGNALAPDEGGAGAKDIRGGGGDLLVAAAGAIVFALNIAPTEEPLLLARQMGWIRLGFVVITSLVLPYLIVFYAEFGGRDQRRSHDGATQRPIVETLLAYMAAFAVAATMLAAFGRVEGFDARMLAEITVLAFPSSIGAALGRVLV